MTTKYNKNHIKQYLVKILKMTRKQFKDENGKNCSVEKYVDILLSMPKEDVLEYQKKIEKMKNESTK